MDNSTEPQVVWFTQKSKLNDLRPAMDNILCLAALVGTHTLELDARLEDASYYFTQTINGDCVGCRAKDSCAITALEE